MRNLLFATAALCAVSIPVQAATIQASSTRYSYSDPDGFGPDIRIAPFDPALGRLDAVNLLIQGSVIRNIRVQTPAPLPTSLTVKLVSSINFASESFSFAVPQVVVPYDQALGANVSFRLNGSFDLSPEGVARAALNPPDSFFATIFPTSGFGTSEFGLVRIDVLGIATYTYTPIPEPVSLLLLSTALCWFGASRWTGRGPARQ